MITGFGIYLIVVYVIGILANFWHAGNGGTYQSPGVLIFAGLWGLANLLGIIFLGTGLGV